MLCVRVSGFGYWVLLPTKSKATSLWACNTVPCRGIEFWEKVRWKASQESRNFLECPAAPKLQLKVDLTADRGVCAEVLERKVVLSWPTTNCF